MGRDKSLDWLVEQYANSRDAGQGTIKQLGYTVARFGDWLGRPPIIGDLGEPAINAWIRAMVDDGGLSIETIRSKRRHLVMLRRLAYERGWMRTLGTVRPVKPAARVPVAWSQDEIAALLAAAATKTSRLKRHRAVRWCDFWRAFILTGYYSGLRFGDLLRLKFDALATDGTAIVIQHKTGRPVVLRLPPDCLESIRAIRKPERARIFGDLVFYKTIQEEFRWLVRESKVGGSIKRLRASGATWVEAHNPGAAMAFLGHRTPGLAYAHYCDPRFIQQNKPIPPQLPPAG